MMFHKFTQTSTFLFSQHEMIHAFLYYTAKEGGTIVKPHGEEFKRKSREINEALNINITTRHRYIYWYRCDGSCRKLESHLFGYVSSIRKKASSDLSSYKDHHLTCGGSFHETTEPAQKLLKTIMKQYRTMKSKVQKKKKTPAKSSNDRQLFTLRIPRPLDSKSIDYATSDDEA